MLKLFANNSVKMLTLITVSENHFIIGTTSAKFHGIITNIFVKNINFVRGFLTF